MPCKSKRQLHSQGIAYAFIRKRPVESDNCSASSGMGADVGASDDNRDKSEDVREEINNVDVSVLLELCKAKCSLKYLSVLLYMTLRKFGCKLEKFQYFFKRNR